MIRRLREECARQGFDLCDPIHTQWYNDLIEGEGHVSKGTLQKIPEPPSISEDTEEGSESLQYNAVLIGNSKSIWPKFVSWLSSQYDANVKNVEEKGGICDKDDILNQLLTDSPFDTFVTETLSAVFWSCSDRERSKKTEENRQLESYELYWSNGFHHKVDLGDESSPKNENESMAKTSDYHCFAQEKTGQQSSFLVSMQRVAKVTGNYWHDEEGTKLCVHPKFGTWKAFRVVLVFHSSKEQQQGHGHGHGSACDDNMKIPEAPPMCPCPVAPEEIEKAKEVMEYALRMAAADGKDGNDDNMGYGSVKPSGNNDLCTYLHNSVTSGLDWSKISPKMRPWIQLRDCISVGREEYKYCDSQLLYHYTKDPDILRIEINKS
jgi:hypothetical protein